MSLNIVADENIPNVALWFSHLGTVRTVPGRSLSREHIADADVLLVRSVTKVNEALLHGSKVRFVGTATIGTDHLDTDYLNQHAIAWSNAPGSNATSVVEYVLAALADVDDVLERLLSGAVLGIVGGGNVGGRLYRRLSALGIAVNVFDPFLDQSSGLPLVTWTELLSSDVICLHTPLTRMGAHPTHHLFNQSIFSQISDRTVILNAGRGDVIDNSALLEWLSGNQSRRAILDVWENEPDISQALFSQVRIGTPHIAGYSLDGKLAGSWQLYEALASWLRSTLQKDVPLINFPASEKQILNVDEAEPAEVIRQVMHAVYPIDDDYQRLANVMRLDDGGQRKREFDLLRKNYPVRRELAAYRISPQSELSDTTLRMLLKLGLCQ